MLQPTCPQLMYICCVGFLAARGVAGCFGVAGCCGRCFCCPGRMGASCLDGLACGVGMAGVRSVDPAAGLPWLLGPAQLLAPKGLLSSSDGLRGHGSSVNAVFLIACI